MSGYTRQSVAQIQDGQIVSAAPVNAEYDAIQTAFSSVSGHKHDGTPSEGAPITTVGPSQNVNVTATELYPRADNYLSIGTSALQIKDIFAKGTATLGSAAISGTFSVTGNSALGGTLTVTGAMTGSTSITSPHFVAALNSIGHTFTGLGAGLRYPSTNTLQLYVPSGNSLTVGATNTSVSGNFAVTGTSTFTGEVTATNGVESDSGSASGPAYSFSVDTDTGIYRPGVNQVGVATGGTLRAVVSDNSVEASVPVLLPDGTLSNPSLSFSSDQNTGIARFGADSMSFVTGGATSVSVDTGGLSLANGRYIRFTNNTFFKFDDSVGVVPSVTASLTSTGTQIIVTVPQENPTMFWLWPTVNNTGNVTMRVNGGGTEAVRTPTEGVLPANYLSYDTVTFPILMVKPGAGTWYAFRQFESGINGDGYWARYPNGTQICTHTVSVGDITTAIGSLFQSPLQTWTFPKPFVTTTFLSVTGSVESANGRYFAMNGISTSASTYRSVGPVSSATASNVRLMAVGRWFG